MSRGGAAPLYRRVNTRTHGVWHGGEKARHLRGTKAARDPAHPALRMVRGARHGLDFTPLYRFLHARVGQPWDPVHSEALGRLPEEAPLWHIVSRDGQDPPVARVGESSYFSRLVVTEGVLRVLEPALENRHLFPLCACCTHTFNGARFVNRFDPRRTGLIHM